MAIRPADHGVVASAGGAEFLATGGTETTHGSYKVHTFLTSSNFVIVSGVSPAIDILIVAGGGSGSYDKEAGGGGAGGMFTQAVGAGLTASTNAVTVGAGGAVASYGQYGNKGTDSVIAIGGSTYTADGGGASVGGWLAQVNGGSGAGAYATGSLTYSPGTGVAGQGNAGGNGAYSSGGGWYWTGGLGGGGGKGGVGGNGTAGYYNSLTIQGGASGAGATNDYRTGSGVTYAEGGSGTSFRTFWNGTSSSNTTLAATTGATAGRGTYWTDNVGGFANSTNADVNSGSGGANNAGGYGAGGSGIVVIRYLV